jgi:hypothetical protein
MISLSSPKRLPKITFRSERTLPRIVKTLPVFSLFAATAASGITVILLGFSMGIEIRANIPGLRRLSSMGLRRIRTRKVKD